MSRDKALESTSWIVLCLLSSRVTFYKPLEDPWSQVTNYWEKGQAMQFLKDNAAIVEMFQITVLSEQ